MPSRDIRRLRARKEGSVAETLEKRHEMHPALYIFSVVILVVIVVTFVGSPVAGRLSNYSSIPFGYYDGREIAYAPGNYFAQQYEAIQRQNQSSGTNQQQTEADIYSALYQAFQATAVHVAVLEQAGQAGMVISEKALDKALTRYPAYLDDTGNFSEQLYNQTSVADRATTRKLERENMIASQYYTDVATEVKTSPQELAFVTAMGADERKFQFVSWLFTAFPDSEVGSYGEANRSKFVKEKVSVITITSSERDAQEIRKKLTDTPTRFAELAKSLSKDSYASAGGDMGLRYEWELEQELEQKDQAGTILALKAGEVSPVLKGATGWTIWRCDAEAVQPDFADAATLTAVRSYLDRYEKGKVEDWFVAQGQKFARRAAEVGFDAAAREEKLAVDTTSFFPINLQGVFALSPLTATPESATPYSASYSEDFFHRAFSLGRDQASSQPIVLDDQVLVLHLSAEQKMPAQNESVMPQLLASIANQSLQYDLQQQLLGGNHLKSEFDAGYAKLVPSSQRG